MSLVTLQAEREAEQADLVSVSARRRLRGPAAVVAMSLVVDVLRLLVDPRVRADSL